MGAIVVKRDLA
ncbi:hypothetical protein F383_28391 [Gossypium arboreum]|uniref:Uncharacterized protein n=1 Tax=Gossypium arboreum TaxID=29729 RepID=A0A0B0MQX2_GOSAR|nr:hypothetical protein F383_28391 [Gossypium arboreum]